MPSARDERVLCEHFLSLESPQDRRKAGRFVGGRVPLGSLPGRLARKASAHRQQRFSSTRAPLCLEDVAQGGQEHPGRARRLEEVLRDRRPAVDSGVGRRERLMLYLLFLSGLGVSVLSYMIAAGALVRLRRRGRGAGVPGFSPPVSILKPLSGLDEGLEENLESFYRLDYPEYEIVFSFARREDPAFAVARMVADRHPEISSLFVVDAREPGGNAKVNRLAAGIRRARHRLLLLSDGNVRVRPDFLGRAVSWFSGSRVGLVSHIFRAVGARSLGSRLESLHLNGALQ